ncbi:28S ribosomal protein S22, mitochondrial [Aricia agestis]|uniref:28S ribosomal protein S22, mitochondrial n=1 Tax=Aricia agestis TaxID=91739 RepID=UPI001C203FA7|nr:28S ribosomal protein S22, mitochondrial [Aricia agestis]
MSLLKLLQNNVKHVKKCHNEKQIILISHRKLSFVPSVYDTEDPAPKFFSPNVQTLLKRLTRPDFAKVFRKRTTADIPHLKTPIYKFLTEEDLQIERAKANKKAKKLLQMPPVVKIQGHISEVLSKDPALQGYDSATYLFTDITFGVRNEERFIVQRNPDGTLCKSDHDTRKKLNQIYFPLHGRKIREPLLFSDMERFNSLLEKHKYEYLLDRACIQYEPDEQKYQELTSLTYQHVDTSSQFNLLRSTRHFGPLAFYLTWHNSMDNLVLETVQGGAIREAALLVALRHELRADVEHGAENQALVAEIMKTPIQLSKPEHLTEEDITLDTKCVDSIEKYIAKNSTMKSQQSLALQGFREDYQQLIDLSRGLRKAHGAS